MLTVLLSTCDRPLFLRTALWSVRNQSARDQIARVIVSENGGRNESQNICAEFSDLPICYRFRKPPVDLFDHLPLLLSETETPYVAMLHDDDWWHPHHVENGLRCVLDGAGRGAYWAAFLRVTSESSGALYANSSFWQGAGYPPLTSIWRLSAEQVILACIWHTPAHYSGLIANRDLLRGTCDVYTKRNAAFDNDRIVATELAKRGLTFFNPVPEVCVRYHLGSETTRFEARRARYLEATTHYLLDEAAALGLEVKTELERLLRACPPKDRAFVLDTFEKPARKVLQQRGAMPPTLKDYLARTRVQRYAHGLRRRWVKYRHIVFRTRHPELVAPAIHQTTR